MVEHNAKMHETFSFNFFFFLQALAMINITE